MGCLFQPVVNTGERSCFHLLDDGHKKQFVTSVVTGISSTVGPTIFTERSASARGLNMPQQIHRS